MSTKGRQVRSTRIVEKSIRLLLVLFIALSSFPFNVQTVIAADVTDPDPQAVNDPPYLEPIENKTVDQLALLEFTAEAWDANGNEGLTFSLKGAPEGAEIDEITGDFTWTPTEAQGPGDYKFDVCVSDGVNDDVCQPITVTVRKINSEPVLNTIGTKSVQISNTLEFKATVQDPESGYTLIFSLEGAPDGAKIEEKTGDFTWTPLETGFFTFTVKVCVYGREGLCDSEMIEVRVVEKIDPFIQAVDDSYSTGVNEKLVVEAPGVLQNDSSSRGNETLKAMLVKNTSYGELELNDDGSFTYVPGTDFTGVDSFTYNAYDGDLTSIEATVSITVSPLNTAPVLDPIGNQHVGIGILLEFTASASDVDGDKLTFSLLEGAPEGAAIDEFTGAFTWTPTEAGKVTFTVRVTDNREPVQYDEETITVTVTHVPVAYDDDYSTDEDQVRDITEPGVLENDSDLDGGDPFTAVLVSGPTKGSLTLNPNGSFTYTPAHDYYGLDSFTYKANDGTSDSNIATVSLTIEPVNDAPVLGAIAPLSVAEVSELAFTASASDVDGDTLNFSLVNGTEGPDGAAIDEITGDFTWTPTEAQGPGDYKFDVCVSDGLLSDCKTITVTVSEVNVAPVLGAIAPQSVAEGSELSFTALGTDSDIPANTLTYSLEDGDEGAVPAGAEINPSTGAFSWTPAETGDFTFTVKVCDDGTPVLCDSETITVTVEEIVIAVQASDDSYSTKVNESLTVEAPGVLGNDSGVNLTAIKESDPQNGTLTFNADGSFTYEPDTNYYGEDSFTYKANDGTTDSNIATVVITVTPPNSAPVCVSSTLGTRRNTWVKLIPDCVDADGDDLSYQIVGQPVNGAAYVWDDELVYIPNPGFYGADNFNYIANDGKLDSNTVAVDVTVSAATLATKPPRVPALRTPTHTRLITRITPRLNWTNSIVPHGTVFSHYQLQVATDLGFNDIVVETFIEGLTNSEYTITPAEALVHNQRYYWRVRAFNTFGQYKGWSKVRYFREAMLAPELLIQANGAEPDNLRPEFDWEDVEGATSYQVQISVKPNMGTPQNNKAYESFFVPRKDLQKNKVLYWRVRANGPNGPSPWSETRWVKTPNPPSTPVLLLPVNNAVVATLTPLLRWKVSVLPVGTEFKHYQLQVAKDAGFTQMVEKIITNRMVAGYMPSALEGGTRHYWRMRAYNTFDHYSSWSRVFSFVTP